MLLRWDHTRIIWLALQAQKEKRGAKKDFVPTISAVPDLSMLLADGQRKQIEREILPDYIRNCRWFGAKARTVRDMRVAEEVPIGSGKNAARFWFVEVNYTDGPQEMYSPPGANRTR